MTEKAADCRYCGAKPEHQTKITTLQDLRPQYPNERIVPLNEGPWRVIPSEKRPPYKFAVVGKNDVAVAYTENGKIAQAYAEQMNTNGYIEVY